MRERACAVCGRLGDAEEVGDSPTDVLYVTLDRERTEGGTIWYCASSPPCRLGAKRLRDTERAIRGLG